MFKRLILVLICFCSVINYAQYNNRNFSISLNGVYTTTAKIYLNPNSSDEFLRNSSFPIDDIFNFSFELRYRLSDALLIGLSSEYMKKTAVGENLIVFHGASTRLINVEDGFSLIPVELTIFYVLPFSTENFKFTMGGGMGTYIGDHIRKFGDVEVSNLERKFAYGIHVQVGMEYMIRQNISIRGEMKFRDPQFNLKSSYNKREIAYEGDIIRLGQTSFDSKVNVDGVTFLLGAAFHF